MVLGFILGFHLGSSLVPVWFQFGTSALSFVELIGIVYLRWLCMSLALKKEAIDIAIARA